MAVAGIPTAADAVAVVDEQVVVHDIVAATVVAVDIAAEGRIAPHAETALIVRFQNRVVDVVEVDHVVVSADRHHAGRAMVHPVVGRAIADSVQGNGLGIRAIDPAEEVDPAVFNEVAGGSQVLAIARSGRLGEKLHALVSIDPAANRDLHPDRQGPFAPTDPPPTLDWDFWQGPAPERPFTPARVGGYRWWWEYTGGQVADWGIHHLDIALWALGGEAGGPEEIEGEGELPPGVPDDFDLNAFLEGRQELPPIYTAFLQFDCTLRFAAGHTIHLLGRRNEIILEGERGRIRVNRGGLTGRPIEEINANAADREWLDEEVTRLYRGMRLTSHMGNFFDCVKDRKLPISDVFTHNRAMELAHTANMAMLLKRKLRWDPERREFKDDARANAHAIVRRAQRKPWTIEA